MRTGASQPLNPPARHLVSCPLTSSRAVTATYLEEFDVKQSVNSMHIVSSSPKTVTVASPTGEFAFTLFGALVFFVTAAGPLLFTNRDAFESAARYWQLKGIGAFALMAGLAILATTKYRRWMFDGDSRTATIDEYGVLGRSRRLESEIKDVIVETKNDYGYPYNARPWKCFVLLRNDGMRIILGPTGGLGLSTGENTLRAIRNALGFPPIADAQYQGER